MNPILRFVIRKMDNRCSEWEARSETDHRVPDGIQEYLDIPYQGAEGIPLEVDVFRAKDRGLRPLPVIVMIHGGGLVVGTRKMSRTFCENLAERGFLVFAPEYRKLTEAGVFQAIGDVAAAFSFISDMIAAFGGDPSRLIVVSESAGTFLSLYAIAGMSSPTLREIFGLRGASLQVRAFACFSGLFYTARRDPVGLVYTRNLYGKKKDSASFLRYMDPECPEVMKQLPPVFLAGSDADFLKGYTKRYADALRRTGHPCTLVYYKGNKKLTHAFPALKPELPESREVLDELLEWSAGFF